MAKYYIESGNFKKVLDDAEPFEACMNAVSDSLDEYGTVDAGETFVVNEKGFPSERVPYVIDTMHEKFFSVNKVIDAVRERGY